MDKMDELLEKLIPTTISLRPANSLLYNRIVGRWMDLGFLWWQ